MKFYGFSLTLLGVLVLLLLAKPAVAVVTPAPFVVNITARFFPPSPLSCFRRI